MYMYMYVYIYIYVCMYVCMYVCIYVTTVMASLWTLLMIFWEPSSILVVYTDGLLKGFSKMV